MNLRMQHESEHSCAYGRLLLVGVGLPHVSETLSLQTHVFYS